MLWQSNGISMPVEYDRYYEEEYFTKLGYKPYFDFPQHATRVEKIIRMTHPKSVLDVGCAYGFIVRKLLDKGIVAFGTDVSYWCEEIANKVVIPGHFLRHDIREPFPFKDKEFDVVYCEGMLEHIEDKYVDQIMKEFNRMSNTRLIAVTLSSHPEAKDHHGHINIHGMEWWFDKMPRNSYLFLPPTGTDGGNCWLYKD